VKIGIVCYASVGGSGVVATELATALAQRGHRIHLISSERPFRWRDGQPGLMFDRIDTPAYPLFREPQYLLALANGIVRVAIAEQLDIVHAHYAVPHATAAYLADQILMGSSGVTPPRTVTTLHGTDITLIGTDPSYARVVSFSIEQSHGVTAVSTSLQQDTIRALGIRRPIEVIPNFLDDSYARRRDPALRARLGVAENDAVVIHMSNFRPVKRLPIVLDVFARIRRVRPARLILIGDGPERPSVERRVAEEGLADAVTFIGEQHDVVPWLSMADVFLLPSSQESFGLAALEAMACEVPVIASRAGGLPELIRDGETGYLCDVDDDATMADVALMVLSDAERARRIGRDAAADVRARFSAQTIVPLYEAFYRSVLK